MHAWAICRSGATGSIAHPARLRYGPEQHKKGRLTSMASAMFDFAPLLPSGLPPAAARWTGLAKYSFVGGNNDPEQVPVEGLIDAVNAVLEREGRTLATYGLASG